MEIQTTIEWLCQPSAIVLYLFFGGLILKFCLENIRNKSKSKIINFVKRLSFIGEALVIVSLVEFFIGIKLIKDAILEGVSDTLIEYRFINNLTDDAHRKILARIIASKFRLNEDDAVVGFYSNEISDSLDSPKFIQDKKVTYDVSLDKGSKNINLVDTIEKTLFLGGQASHEYKSAFPGIYEYAVRINGKDCVQFNLDSDKNNTPPNPFTKPIDAINCQFQWGGSLPPTSYQFITKISSKNKEDKAAFYRFYLRESAHLNDDKFTDFIAIADRVKNVEVTIDYPKDECKIDINGYGKFEQEVKEAKKEHDGKAGREFHHMFAGEYGPESGLYVTVDCS